RGIGHPGESVHEENDQFFGVYWTGEYTGYYSAHPYKKSREYLFVPCACRRSPISGSPQGDKISPNRSWPSSTMRANTAWPWIPLWRPAPPQGAPRNGRSCLLSLRPC